jgi:chromosome segregation ATPase
MLRIFCSTDRCGFQAAQLEAAQAAIADLRARCDALLAERDAAQAENERLREAIKEWAPALREACIRVLPEEAEPWTWLALLGEARDAADALDRALAAPPEEKEVPRG